MIYIRKNKGVCSLSTEVSINEDNIIDNVEVVGGCNGNLKGLCSLIKGMNVQEAISRLEGLTCGNKKTSCPDQIAQALKEAKAQ